ncbi:TPA: DUF547 domain-containing protein [Legionella pneumophila]|nr:DUF547 domain-containing protein [Legionella pneumophila]HAT2066859.1 DUF547 domain-containing protein [Legionella pneumophila]HAT8592944.1 DUF547 domain-containing protein [Legionella pneumophila]HAU1576891.1 DUF547 domain-containing protein [Legionella pneumophila]HAU1680495.1 DUF547 domain-containing protein [Legionella pneumophila]HAU3700846.1 DUF547 domain-containing protein [Legionella pneumophila]
MFKSIFILCRKKILVLFLLSLCFITSTASASFHRSLWPKWLVNAPLSKQSISHQAWQHFLDHHVITNEEDINLVDYTNINEKELASLKEYIKNLSQIDIDNYNRQEQLAYWINLYNALTVLTVANYYPIANIQEINISPGLFSVGPWGANIITIKNTNLSLDDINNRIIRPIWNDPRTHYALNNATIGAPNLSKQAYQGPLLEQQLNDAAFKYINSLRGVHVIEGKLIVSKLYDWYEEDFGGTKKYVIKHLLQFAKEPLRNQLKHINTIDSYIYNWHINCPADNQP